MTLVTSQSEEASTVSRVSIVAQYRDGREELEESKEQKWQLCNDQRRKPRVRSERQIEPGTKTPIAGVAFTRGKHTLLRGNQWGGVCGSNHSSSVFCPCSLKHGVVIHTKSISPQLLPQEQSRIQTPSQQELTANPATEGN